MKPALREHKLPISVTAVGLTVAAALAAAPVLMAESDFEVLSKKNASGLQELSTSLDDRTASLQLAIDQQTGQNSSSIDRLQNQVAILNKATGNLNIKQAKALAPLANTAADVNQLKTNATTRLTNLEKAVTRINQRQRKLTQQSPAPAADAGPDRNTDLRISNLEKAVKRMHQSRSKNNNEPVQATVDSSSDFKLFENRLSALEQDLQLSREQNNNQAVEVTNNSSADFESFDARISVLEQDLTQLQRRKPVTVASNVQRSSRSDIKRRVEADIRLLRMERQLKNIESRLDDMEGTTPKDDVVAEQLIEMRSYIDTLLSEIYK